MVQVQAVGGGAAAGSAGEAPPELGGVGAAAGVEQGAEDFGALGLDVAGVDQGVQSGGCLGGVHDQGDQGAQLLFGLFVAGGGVDGGGGDAGLAGGGDVLGVGADGPLDADGLRRALVRGVA
ncbi:hypothetical protein [Streptacidiphilus sp. PB12-B1b]|uniref:hypothetical protein n=1 Tax=Streptacidiphilus sp. PB12-B1b TaxID=2705012 RepID=UPI002104E065|nr:hypothetical protein [Streptacidiphilus sp. PB12-B1b]